METHKQIKAIQTQKKCKPRLNKTHSAVWTGPGSCTHGKRNIQCTAYMPGTSSTALPSFSHDQHHKTDAAKWKGGGQVL